MTTSDIAALLEHVARLWPGDKSTDDQRRVFAQHCKPLAIPGPRAREIVDREFLAKPRGFTPWADLARALKLEADRIVAETRRLQGMARAAQEPDPLRVSEAENARSLADAVEWVRQQPPGSLVALRERMRESGRFGDRAVANCNPFDWSDHETLMRASPGTCRAIRDFAEREGVRA